MTDPRDLISAATPLPWTRIHIRDDHDELAGAVFDDHPDGALILAVWAEAADVANFAAMLADRYESRAGATGEGETP